MTVQDIGDWRWGLTAAQHPPPTEALALDLPRLTGGPAGQRLHLSLGGELRAEYLNVEVDAEPDEDGSPPVDLSQAPWPWAAASMLEVRMARGMLDRLDPVLASAEVHRLLQIGGLWTAHLVPPGSPGGRRARAEPGITDPRLAWEALGLTRRPPPWLLHAFDLVEMVAFRGVRERILPEPARPSTQPRRPIRITFRKRG